MGNYIDSTDVQNRLRRNFEPLYTPRGWTSSDSDIVDADIEAAEADLHSYIAARYRVPVTDTEAVKLLKHWALTLVEEIAYGSIPGRKVPDNIAERAKALHERLERIAAGDLSLGTASTVTQATTGAGADVMTDGPDPVFTRDQMEGF